jgi:hypothetical protein
MNYKLVDNIEEYIDDIITLDDDFYDQAYLWDNDYQRKVYDRNHDSFIAVSLDNKLVGYLNYLSITKELYNQMKESNEIVDDFKLEDIIPFGDEIYLTVNSIVILKEHQDGEVIKIINNEFLKKINNLSIKGINTIAISPDGNKWAQNMGFTLYKKLDDGNTLYVKE